MRQTAKNRPSLPSRSLASNHWDAIIWGHDLSSKFRDSVETLFSQLGIVKYLIAIGSDTGSVSIFMQLRVYASCSIKVAFEWLPYIPLMPSAMGKEWHCVWLWVARYSIFLGDEAALHPTGWIFEVSDQLGSRNISGQLPYLVLKTHRKPCSRFNRGYDTLDDQGKMWLLMLMSLSRGINMQASDNTYFMKHPRPSFFIARIATQQAQGVQWSGLQSENTKVSMSENNPEYAQHTWFWILFTLLCVQFLFCLSC